MTNPAPRSDSTNHSGSGTGTPRSWAARGTSHSRGGPERAGVLCEDMKHEWLMLHDLMAESVLGLISFVQDRLGDEGVAEAWTQCTERGWKRHHDAINALPRKQLVYLLAATWRAHSGPRVGEAPGGLTITQDGQKG